MRGFALRGMLLLALSMFYFVQGPLFAHNLVDLQKFNPKICIDLRFATYNNILGLPIYPSNRIFVEHYVATRLGRVQRELAKEGLGLIVIEGYRPPSIQCFLDHVYCERGLESSKYEASHYCKGIGVDVMIYYLEGQPIKIPSFYQDSSFRAYRDYPYLSANAYHNSYVLEKYMTANGFDPQREKWWHFDLKGWESAPNLEAEYEELLCR